MGVPKIIVRVTESDCKKHPVGQEFEIEKFCPPLCHEAFYAVYPFLTTLQGGGKVEGPDGEMGFHCIKRCPDRGRVEMDVRLAD